MSRERQAVFQLRVTVRPSWIQANIDERKKAGERLNADGLAGLVSELVVGALDAAELKSMLIFECFENVIKIPGPQKRSGSRHPDLSIPDELHERIRVPGP